MITQEQIRELSFYYQIDTITIIREYLQLVFLSYLYQERKSTKIYFKGGTAIHLLFGSPRFSEDLDFSTEYSKSEIKKIIKKIEEKIEKELPAFKILTLYSGKKSIRFRAKFEDKTLKYPLTIRLDFTEKDKPQKIITSPLVTKFPIVIFPIISHLSDEEILAEKIRAMLTRGKGRDVFDLWFLFSKEVSFVYQLIAEKLAVVGKKLDKEHLLKKVREFPEKKLKQDLDRFLPKSQRKICSILKEELIELFYSKAIADLSSGRA